MAEPLRCKTCGLAVKRPEIGAAMDFLGVETVWCLACWDAEDEAALS